MLPLMTVTEPDVLQPSALLADCVINCLITDDLLSASVLPALAAVAALDVLARAAATGVARATGGILEVKFVATNVLTAAVLELRLAAIAVFELTETLFALDTSPEFVLRHVAAVIFVTTASVLVISVVVVFKLEPAAILVLTDFTAAVLATSHKIAESLLAAVLIAAVAVNVIELVTRATGVTDLLIIIEVPAAASKLVSSVLPAPGAETATVLAVLVATFAAVVAELESVKITFAVLLLVGGALIVASVAMVLPTVLVVKQETGLKLTMEAVLVAALMTVPE